MTPKEKALELIKKFEPLVDFYVFEDEENPVPTNAAKRCALIAVDEILKNLSAITTEYTLLQFSENTTYWQQIKGEIKKL